MASEHIKTAMYQIKHLMKRGIVDFIMKQQHPFRMDSINLIIPLNPLKIHDIELSWIEIKWYYILREKSEIINLGTIDDPKSNNIKYYAFDQEVFTKYILRRLQSVNSIRYRTIFDIGFFNYYFSMDQYL